MRKQAAVTPTHNYMFHFLVIKCTTKEIHSYFAIYLCLWKPTMKMMGDAFSRLRKNIPPYHLNKTSWAAPPIPPPWYTYESKVPYRSKSEEPVSCLRSRRSRICNCNARKHFREYLLTCTLHGLRYIGEGKLTWLERFYWLAAFLSSVTCAAFFIMNIYDKWLEAPMIVSVNPENMNLVNIPFPAVTVCNVNQAKKSVAKRIKDSGSSLNQKLLHSLCTTDNDSVIFNISAEDNADWNYMKGFIVNVTQPCTEMLAACYWRSEVKDCEKLFNAQLTDEGLCCTFNVVHRDMMFRNPNSVSDLNLTFPFPPVDWTPERGFPQNSPPDAFPWKPYGVGTNQGLTLVLDANVAEYYCATTSSAGFKILLHSPIETPKITDFGELYAAGTEARVAVLPKIQDAQEPIISIDINKRHCVFANEKSLVYFRTYTEKNCEMECEARRMLEECNCVQYYMPKNSSTPICGKADSKCALVLQVITENLDTDEKCSSDCLPACTEISYSERYSSAVLSEILLRQSIYLSGRTPEYFKKNMVVVHIYFEDTSFIRFTKGVIFGLTEFLSNIGGLLGLCMGFSIMSVVELIYFVTLRPFCLSRHTHRQQPAFTK